MMLCPTCGKENPDGFAFCGFCTAGLAATPASAAEERKIVTVLFCDLVGFTAASDEADPEDVRATLRPYHALLRTEIGRYGGTVEKFIGDAVMAVFGAPIAHEDDAERAVRAGLRILEAIQELNEDSGLDLSVRIGINTGEAVVALNAKPQEGEGIVTGDVVNTASRLQGAAPVGGIGVGEGTYRATRDVFEYAELDPVTLKGKAEPVTIWSAKAARSRFGTDLAEKVATPFVGRRDDLDVLKSTFRRAIHETSVQLVTVTGEPGVGKSRLLRELFSFIDSQPELVHWRQGRCLPYGEGITFWALGEIVKAHVGILESDSPEDAASKLEEGIRQVVEDPSDREWMKTKFKPLIGLASEGDGEREESFTAWQRFLEAIAATRPLVLAVEDLHWADQALLQFIEHLVDWASGIPMLVLCTARPELFERYATWGAAKRNVSTVSLSPLTEAETATLIAALLEQSVLPAQAQQALLERAGGNPLYAEEFVRMLKDQGILEHKGNAWTLARDAAIPFPDSVQALIAVGFTASSQNRRLKRACELLYQTRLSHARSTDYEHCAALAGRLKLEYRSEFLQFYLATDDARAEGRIGLPNNAEEAPRRNGLALALEREWLDRLGLHVALYETVGGPAEQDLVRRSVLFEPGGGIHGVARRERFAR